MPATSAAGCLIEQAHSGHTAGSKKLVLLQLVSIKVGRLQALKLAW